MVHYFAREFFAPVIVSGWVDNNRSLHIFVVSDEVVPIYKSTVKLSVFRWNSFDPLNVEEIPVHMVIIYTFIFVVWRFVNYPPYNRER